MNKKLAEDLGFLGVNVDRNVDLAWIKTEVANKIREKDVFSVYRLLNLARHSENSKVRNYASDLEIIYKDMVARYDGSYEEDLEVIEVSDVDSIKSLVDSFDSIEISLDSDISVTSSNVIEVNEGKSLTVNLNGKSLRGEKLIFDVNGGSLTINGDGVLSCSGESTSSQAILVENGGVLNYNGGVISMISGNPNNSAYGIYLKDKGVINITGGKIITNLGSCLSDNNVDAGDGIYNISGGELISKGSYAMYIANQSIVNICGGTVHGINARMGLITVSGNAIIDSPGIDETNYDNVGREFNTSGCIWFGDTVAFPLGTYQGKVTRGNRLDFKICGNAKIKSRFRSAVGIFLIDTKYDQTAKIDIESYKCIDSSVDTIRVYDHAYIENEAEKVGKSYSATNHTDVEVVVDNKVVYPVY